MTFSSATGNNTAQTEGSVSAFTITGGGAEFQLDSSIDINGKPTAPIVTVTSPATNATYDTAGTGSADVLRPQAARRDPETERRPPPAEPL